MKNLNKVLSKNIIPTVSKIKTVGRHKSCARIHKQKQLTFKTQLKTFKNSMRYFFILGQYIGLFPIFGTNQMKKYPFFSWRYLYTFVMCLSQLAAAILCFNGIIQTSLNIGKFGRVFFYCKGCLCSFFTLRLASKWHFLLNQVAAADLNKYIDSSVGFKCNVATITLLSLAMFNYILSKISKYATIVGCGYTNSTWYEQYILKSYNWFFGIGVPYSVPLGIFLHILTMVAYLSSTYCQIFIICVSLYLSSILQKLNEKIISLDRKYISSSCWRTLRQDYNRATRLVVSFDDVINSIVLASFAINLFYVCLQVYYVLRNDITIRHGTSLCLHNYDMGLLHGYESVIVNIYFLLSTIFVISRSLIVSLIAARVHSTALALLPVLYSVPPPTYCDEIQRFIDQIHGNTVALTGLNFFKVTKEVILHMVGTIITYELVLLQLK